MADDYAIARDGSGLFAPIGQPNRNARRRAVSPNGGRKYGIRSPVRPVAGMSGLPQDRR